MGDKERELPQTFEEFVEIFKKEIDNQYEEYVKKVKEIEEYQFKLMKETQIQETRYITDYTLRPLKKGTDPYAVLE